MHHIEGLCQKPHFVVTKTELRCRLGVLEDRLNRLMALQHSVDPNTLAFEPWARSHQPFHWFVEFYRIMNQGGFDVIVGNPPYIELRTLTTYKPVGYSCESAGNLYALIMERSTQIASATSLQGFIVPVSSVSTDRYSSLQSLVSDRELYYSSYDDRPSRLFDGLEHIRLTIHILRKDSTVPVKRSTRYHKWFTNERTSLFQRIRYVESHDSLVHNSLPKLSSTIEFGILHKLSSQKRNLGYFLVRSSEHRVYYSRKVGYFLQVLNFIPQVLDGRGNLRNPSEFKELNFADSRLSTCALCCLNLHLFYWFITVLSDCRHVNKREVQAFPVDLERLVNSSSGDPLQRIAGQLMHNLDATSENRVMRFAHDTLTIQTIYPKLSQMIINQIDTELAKYFGFTDEELDFIINYDIKYRMGDELFRTDQNGNE